MGNSVYLLVGILLLTGFMSFVPCSAENKSDISVILTAFGDKNATYGETKPYLEALTDKIDRTSNSTFCKCLMEGNISNQPVLVVTTGTGLDNSGSCIQEILQMYPQRIKEVIWSGIGGGSSAVGGLVDVKNGKLKENFTPVMIGDICVSPMVWNYDLHFSSVADWKWALDNGDDFSNAGWWQMKNSQGDADVPGFDSVRQFVRANKTLSDEITDAADTINWQEPQEDVRSEVLKYFPESEIRNFKVFNCTQCAEISSNTFWHGVHEDRLARHYVADLISGSDYVDHNITEDDVIALSAMESISWMNVVQEWTKKTGEPIQVAIVRSVSDYNHPPLDEKGGILTVNGSPISAMDDIKDGFKNSIASVAVKNAANPVLKMFELREASTR